MLADFAAALTSSLVSSWKLSPYQMLSEMGYQLLAIPSGNGNSSSLKTQPHMDIPEYFVSVAVLNDRTSSLAHQVTLKHVRVRVAIVHLVLLQFFACITTTINSKYDQIRYSTAYTNIMQQLIMFGHVITRKLSFSCILYTIITASDKLQSGIQ